MIRGIQSVSVVIFAFFFAVAGARFELSAVREFWFLLLIEERFPAVGSDIVALGMAVIIGSILGGPILLKRAITMPGLPEPGNGEV